MKERCRGNDGLLLLLLLHDPVLGIFLFFSSFLPLLLQPEEIRARDERESVG